LFGEPLSQLRIILNLSITKIDNRDLQ